MKIKHDWRKEDLKKIQFYTSQDIVLQREIHEGDTAIEQGKIKVVDGKKIEEVVIPQGTPGVLEHYPGDGRLGISFEVGDNRFLMFGANQQKGNRYSLLAKDWAKNNIGQVTYEQKTYYTSPGSGDAFLMVDLNKIQKRQKKKRTAKGRKIGE